MEVRGYIQVMPFYPQEFPIFLQFVCLYLMNEQILDVMFGWTTLHNITLCQ